MSGEENKNIFETLKNYVQSHTVDEIIFLGLKHFFDINYDISLEALIEKYRSEKFNELGENLHYFQDNIRDLKENFCEYEKIYNNLKEEKSRNVFSNMLCAKVFMDISFIREAYDSDDIYFDLSIWTQLSNEVYVDCGGYSGDTALSFICHCPDYKKIFVLEPMEEAEMLCKNNLQWFIQEGNVTVIKRAAYDQDIRLTFNEKHGTGDSCIDENGKTSVFATSLDQMISEPVSFIKMDIEGSERKALMGARRHIAQDTPKMAICVYHLKDDFWKIPQLLLSINSNYDIIFRQHRPDVFSETVMYAIPKNSNEIVLTNHRADLIYCRIKNALNHLLLISTDEYTNLITIIKDKAWYLYQIRMHIKEIEHLRSIQTDFNDQFNTLQKQYQEQKLWLDELQTAKDYLDAQNEAYLQEIKNLNSSLVEQKKWTESLQKGKDYLENQNSDLIKEVEALQNILSDQKSWSEELQKGKDYLEIYINRQKLDIEKAKNDIFNAENQISELKNDQAKLKYKYTKLVNDPLIKKIIKLKKIEL